MQPLEDSSSSNHTNATENVEQACALRLLGFNESECASQMMMMMADPNGHTTVARDDGGVIKWLVTSVAWSDM